MSDRKNVLMIVLDSCRGDALAVNGNPICRTPNLDALAGAGVSFRRCFAQNPTCAASRAALLTGWYPHVRGHRTFTYHIQPDEENLLKYFKRAGYTVKAAGTNDCLHEDCFPDSLDEWLESAGTPIDGAKGDLSADPVKRKAFLSGRLPDAAKQDRNWSIKENSVDFLRAQPDGPWCLYSALHIPHPKYGVPEPWCDMYSPDDMPEPIACGYEDKQAYMDAWHRLSNMDKLEPRDIKRIRALYYGMVSLADHYVGEMLDALQASGAWDDTTVVLCSDHGDYTGDYGLVEKGHASVHDCLINVPLIIKPPAGTPLASRVESKQVELIDILPTLLEINGIELAHQQYGRSLCTLLADPDAEHKDAVFCEGGYGPGDYFTLDGVRMAGSKFLESPESVYGPRCKYIAEHPELVDRYAVVRTPEWKYVQRGSGHDELYDLDRDPDETLNLAIRGTHDGVVRQMRDRLLEWYLRTADAVPFRIDDRLCGAAWDPVRGLRK